MHLADATEARATFVVPPLRGREFCLAAGPSVDDAVEHATCLDTFTSLGVAVRRVRPHRPPPGSFLGGESDWEIEFCRVAESHPRVIRYVKNHNLGIEVPYNAGKEAKRYRPDFILQIDDGNGEDDLLNLIVEVKGLQSQLIDLERINADPTYQLLLYLFSLPETSTVGPDFLSKVLSFLRRWCLKRLVSWDRCSLSNTGASLCRVNRHLQIMER